MFRALSLAIGQLGDPAILKLLAKSLALTLLVFAIGGVALYFLLVWAIGLTGWGGGGGLAALGAVAVAGVCGWFLWRAVAMGVVGLFAENIVAAVEARHYPAHHARALDPGISEQVRASLGSIGRALGWNLLALPVYLLLLVTGIGTVALFIGLNTLLLARDLGDLIALRHVPEAARRDWLRQTRARRLQLGLVSAVLFVIPVANLLAPILSAAMAAHMLHAKDRTRGTI